MIRQDTPHIVELAAKILENYNVLCGNWNYVNSP